jgi:hypothetical protein
MERTVPSTASEEIELYLRTLYSLLRSTTDVQIRTLEEVHAGMNSLMHPAARKSSPDISAFIYSLLRLPECMPEVQSIVLGQSLSVFARGGLSDIEQWQPVSARARRRRCFYNGKDTLACFIASRTDIEDVVPNLTAYQIEWNKLHIMLQNCPPEVISRSAADPRAFEDLAGMIEITPDDLERLRVIWGNGFQIMLELLRRRPVDFRLRLLSGPLIEYNRATREWWDHISSLYPDLLTRPVYFVSSNTHSLLNLVTGFALHEQDELIRFLEAEGSPDLLQMRDEARASGSPAGAANFLYYFLKKYQQSVRSGPASLEAQIRLENQLGIARIPSEHSFDVEAQVVDLSRLNLAGLDPRLQSGELQALKSSDALILNIDYPLGLTAYDILTKVAEYVSPTLGVYVMGKAASLNAVMGDVIIPNVVQDEHSRNTYLFHNAFTAGDVAPHLIYGTVLDNQKAISVLGTFLQNARIMDVFYREGFSDIEMESGPYLSAIYEMYRPKRYPENEIVNLYGVPFDIGILHYVSDTPMGKGRNLGAGTLSYYGMDSTYATTIAILRRIFELEINRMAILAKKAV